MIPLHRPLSLDHQTYVIALIEWQRALDLTADCCRTGGAEDDRRVRASLYPALIAVAKAGERLSLAERRSIAAAMSAAAAVEVPTAPIPGSRPRHRSLGELAPALSVRGVASSRLTVIDWRRVRESVLGRR